MDEEKNERNDSPRVPTLLLPKAAGLSRTWKADDKEDSDEETVDDEDDDEFNSEALEALLRPAPNIVSKDGNAEIAELNRLLYSALTEDRRASIRLSIETLLRTTETRDVAAVEVGEGELNKHLPRPNLGGMRPMSARRMVSLRTIPEDKPLARALTYTVGIRDKVVEEDEDEGRTDRSPHRSQAHRPALRSSTYAALSSSSTALEAVAAIAAHEAIPPGNVIRSTTATAHDPRRPPEAIFDGHDGTFWITTGCYPHLLTVQFTDSIHIDKVLVLCQKVTKLALSWAGTALVPGLGRACVSSTDERGIFTFDTSGAAIQFLCLEVLSGQGDFCLVHHVRLLRHVQ